MLPQENFFEAASGSVWDHIISLVFDDNVSHYFKEQQTNFKGGKPISGESP